MTRTHRPRLLELGLALLLSSGCEGIASSAGSPFPTVPADPTTTASCGDAYLPGHAMIHRLSNVEYNNTVRDLLFTTRTPADAFASSSVGSSGFTNQSDVLTLSDQIVADYVKAAQDLADEVQASQATPNGAFAKLAGCAAQVPSPTPACVQSVVQHFAENAFRRPIDADDLAALMTVYGGETTFADGFHDVIVAVLIDPRFLFSYIVHPSPDDPTVIAALDDFEVASRLSYFIWQSMPDDTLLTLAATGTLKDATTLQTQVARMLADPKSKSFVTTWRRDWAHLTLLDANNGYGGLDATLTSDLRQETELTIADVVARDQSLLTLVTGSDTFANANTASFYGWSGLGLSSSTFTRIPNPDPARRGVLTQAALMLTVGGGESYTHPVQRGRWVMDSLLCQPPGPPPPGVPTLAATSSSDLPIRDRLAQHVANPSCQGCHVTMDVYGLGLENFDMQGKWRTTYAALNNTPIDASGTLPDGRAFSGPAEMTQLLGQDPQVRSCLATKVMSYAMARPMGGIDDSCVAKVLGAQYVQPDSKLSDLFTHVALSHQFLTQAGAAP